MERLGMCGFTIIFLPFYRFQLKAAPLWMMVKQLVNISWVVPLLRMPVANEGKKAGILLLIILVVTITGKGNNPKYVYIYIYVRIYVYIYICLNIYMGTYEYS